VPEYSGPPVDTLYSLRTAIIHDNPTPEQVQQIAEARPELFQLAKRVIASATAEVSP
jgi:hypothetical protein